METIQNIYSKPSKTGHDYLEPLTVEEPDIKEGSDKKWVRCRNCHYKIALLNDRIKVNDTDSHLFENPGGIFFRVICFSEAPGSISISEYTIEDTWFPGYCWSITLCRSCNNHLGWNYNSGSAEFYGLIADRLAGI